MTALDPAPYVSDDAVFIDSKTRERISTAQAYRAASALLAEMADRIEADEIDIATFRAVEARCVVELGRAQAGIVRFSDLLECRGEG